MIIDTTESSRASSIEALVENVKSTRGEVEGLQTRLTFLRTEFEQQNADLIQAVKEARDRRAEAENRLRARAISEYHLTKKKKPVSGVGIKLIRTVVYDPQTALDWAMKKGICLTLDHNAFERAAKSGAIKDLPARIEEIPQATIAKEL